MSQIPESRSRLGGGWLEPGALPFRRRTRSRGSRARSGSRVSRADRELLRLSSSSSVRFSSSSGTEASQTYDRSSVLSPVRRVTIGEVDQGVAVVAALVLAGQVQFAQRVQPGERVGERAGQPCGAQHLQAVQVAEGVRQGCEGVVGDVQQPQVPQPADGLGQPGQLCPGQVEFFEGGQLADARVDCLELGVALQGEDPQVGEGEELLGEVPQLASGQVESCHLLRTHQQRVQLLQGGQMARPGPGAQHLPPLAQGLRDLPLVGRAVIVEEFGQQDGVQFLVGEVHRAVGRPVLGDEQCLRLLGEGHAEVRHADDDPGAGPPAHHEPTAVPV